ncbi:hypothetical protein Cco03nite_39270 [Catellatospora coxensis]|uniref:Uncharacterized protein n=2 Tax=Catellatospora coxensis TaxID=310354 RepID=A0A8J3KQH2_9ACTN|nr:hypothetical protein Cco03nite_39270 [Catellatospora coxensis]
MTGSLTSTGRPGELLPQLTGPNCVPGAKLLAQVPHSFGMPSPAWLRLPKTVRREVWRLAQAGLPHPDPAVHEAVRAQRRALDWAWRSVALCWLGTCIYRGLATDPVEGWRLVSWVAVGLMMMAGGVGARFAQIDAAQWPAAAAREGGAARPVRLRLPAPWSLRTIVLIGLAPAIVMWFGLWTRGREADPGRPLFTGSVLVALLLAAIGFAVVWWRRKRLVLEVDEHGVRLPSRGLDVPWDQVAEIAAVPADRKGQELIGVAVRLRDPRAVWAARRPSFWRRLLWGRGGSRPWIFVTEAGVREPMFPAYAAALAYHAAHLKAEERQTSG